MNYMSHLSGLLIFMWPQWMRDRLTLFPWRQKFDQDCYIIPGYAVIRLDW